MRANLPKNASDPTEYFKMHRISQITDSHCGPAVIQMLLSNLGINVSQGDVAMAGGATDLIELHGMRVDQLAQAVRVLAPEAQFWYKYNATLDDIQALLTEHHYPVGVEWQGLFDDEGNELEDPEPDYGHYSVITHLDRERDQLIIVDPYKDYVSRDRIFTLHDFDERWWDFNEVTNSATGKPEWVEDYHMLFIVTPKDTPFPAQLGLKR